MGAPIYSCAGADVNNLPSSAIDSVLINALDHGSTPRKIKAAQKMLRKANARHSIGDSSGYQLHMADKKGRAVTFDPNLPLKNTAKALNISPQQVMQANAIHQPDILIGLDWPIRKLKSEVQKQVEFYNKLRFNVPWAFESFAWKNALIPDAQYFQPIQCYTLDHLDLFLNEIRGVHFDGVSMPVRTLKPSELALFLVSFYKRGITRVHLLGTSNFATIAICAYAARYLFEWVSLDSTSWRIAADKAEFINPIDLGRIKVKLGIDVTGYPPNECPCPSCQGRNFPEIQAIEPRKDKADFLRRHNWWALNTAIADACAASANMMLFEQFLKARCKKATEADELYRILSLVDCLKDGDIHTLRFLLAPNPKRRKPTHRARKATKPKLSALEVDQ